MRGIVISAILIVLVVGIGVTQAEAYEMFPGQISLTNASEDEDSIIGVIYEYEGYVTYYELEQEVFNDPVGDMDIRLLDPDGDVVDSFTTPIDSDQLLGPEGEEEGRWGFAFEIDTGKYDLSTGVIYTLEVSHLHMMDEITFAVDPTPAQGAIAAGEAFSQMEQQQADLKANPAPIPEWVKEIFVFYGDGEISDEELINAIEFLIKVDLIIV